VPQGVKVKDVLGLLLSFLIRRGKEFDKLLLELKIGALEYLMLGSLSNKNEKSINYCLN
jgi:hypothetical protein